MTREEKAELVAKIEADIQQCDVRLAEIEAERTTALAEFRRRERLVQLDRERFTAARDLMRG